MSISEYDKYKIGLYVCGDMFMKGGGETDFSYDREDRIGDCDINGNLIIAYTHGPG